MNGDDDLWTEDREPADDARVLHAGPPLGLSGSGPSDYAAAIADQETAWWAALSDYEYAYALVRALEQASARGAPWSRRARGARRSIWRAVPITCRICCVGSTRPTVRGC